MENNNDSFGIDTTSVTTITSTDLATRIETIVADQVQGRDVETIIESVWAAVDANPGIEWDEETIIESVWSAVDHSDVAEHIFLMWSDLDMDVEEDTIGYGVLKLNRLGRQYPDARKCLVLGSQSAADSIRGWLKEEIDDLGIEIFVLPKAN